MKFAFSIFYLLSSAAVATDISDHVELVEGADPTHSEPTGECSDLNVAINTQLRDLLAFDDVAIEEHLCNGVDRKKIRESLLDVQALDLDECQMEVFGPAVENLDAILRLLEDEDSCRAEVGYELAEIPRDNEGRKLFDLMLTPLISDSLFAEFLAETQGDRDLVDGTLCYYGFTCHRCINPVGGTFWLGFTGSTAGFRCGYELCFGQDVSCRDGVSCNNCCKYGTTTNERDPSNFRWENGGSKCNGNTIHHGSRFLRD